MMSHVAQVEIAESPVPGVQGEPSRTEMVIYGLGEVASNLSWLMVTGFLLYYYTDVARIPAAPLVWLFLLTKIFDAAIDLGAGALVDRTRSRWGHARPYLLFAAVPYGLMCVLTFSVPEVFSPQAKVVYAFITYGLLGLTYSLVYVPYAALQPRLSSDPHKSNWMGGLRSMGTCVGAFTVYASTQPLIKLMGGGAIGFTLTACIFSVGSVLLYLLVFAGTKERVPTSSETPPLLVAVGRMARNRTWLGSFLLMLINFFRVVVLVSGLPYAAKLLFGNIALLGLFLSIQSAGVLLGSILAGPLMNRFGVVAANLVGIAVSISMFFAMMLVEGQVLASCIFFAIASIPIGIFNSTSFADCANAATLQEEMFGSRDEGLLASGLSFGQKVGGAVGTALVALLLSLSHYNPDHISPAALTMARAALYWAQIGLLVLHIPAIMLLRFNQRRDLARR